MENTIIINGQCASGEPLEWLYNQDLTMLHHFLASQVLANLIEDGKGFGATLNPAEAKAFYVLIHFLNHLREIKAGRAEA